MDRNYDGEALLFSARRLATIYKTRADSFIRLLLIVLGCLALTMPLSGSASDWSQWRGPNRDGKSPETDLLKQWPPEGPKLAWKTSGLGKGYGSVSIKGDRIYAIGDLPDANYLMAMSADGGKILWSTKVGKAGNYGPPGWEFAGPRCTPTVDGGLVLAVDQWGELVCANAADGKEQWRKNYLKDLGAEKPPEWGYSESPLVDGDHVVVTPGGSKGAMAALDKKTGAVIWQSKNFTDPAHYASIVIADLGGTRQYVQLTAASVVGISPKDGAVLWRAARKGNVAVIPTPVVDGNDVYVTSGYGVGCQLFHVTKAGDKFSVKQVYANHAMVNHHGGVLKVGDDIYGYSDSKGLTCQDFKSGEVRWAEKEKVQKGCLSYADGLLYFRQEDNGTMIFVEATPSGYHEKGRFRQPQRAEEKAWAHPSIANGKLYLRDQDLLLCYELK
jgi:outer membrane protein assembly factor BamB